MLSSRGTLSQGGILSRKPLIHILVLGPYKPRSAKSKLGRLRTALRNNGYAQTFLLEDHTFRDQKPEETVEVYFALKGRHYLSNWADIALFVFMCKANNMGVLSEFDFVQYNLRLLSRTSSVLIDENCPFPSLTTGGTITLSGVNQRMFRSEKRLERAAIAECLGHIRTLY